MQMKATREAYGETLSELGEKDERIVVLDADLSNSTKSAFFGRKFPERFFNMGIAEANVINTAAGFATTGKVAFASSFCIFISGRTWEQIRNTVCYSRLNVRVVGSHGGITVGADGSSHQAIEDIAIMRAIPKMTIAVPCDAIETKKLIQQAVDFKGPMYIRLGRPKVPTFTKEEDPFEIGKGNVLKEGKDITLIAYGALVYNTLKAAEILQKEGINATVINMHTIKPIDEDLIVEKAKETGAILTAEQHVLQGGLGSAVAEVLVKKYPTKMRMLGLDNEFGQSGSPDDLIQRYKLTAKDIADAAKKFLSEK